MRKATIELKAEITIVTALPDNYNPSKEVMIKDLEQAILYGKRLDDVHIKKIKVFEADNETEAREETK